MKSKIKVLSVMIALLLSSLLFTKQASAQQSYFSYQLFYDQLSPYGEWVDYPEYGYVWIPNEGTDFVPYSSRGHWVFSDYGWTWVSDYSWGWAPFHYGRWDFDNYYGWFWIPDNEWGPAWVTWRRSSGYYGWSPLGPGISLSVSFGRGYDNHNDHWIFVRDRDIDRSNISRYYVNRADHDRIIRNSTVINNTYVDNSRNTTYVTGPDRRDIQSSTGRRINPVNIEDYNRPGQDLRNGQLRIYKPRMTRSNEGERRPAPDRIVNLKDVNRPADRNMTNQRRNSNIPTNNRMERQTETSSPAREINRVNPDRRSDVNNSNSNSRDQQINNVNQRNNNARTIRKQEADQKKNTVNQQNENTRTIRMQEAEQQTNTVNQRNDNTRTIQKQEADQQKNTVNQQGNDSRTIKQEQADPPRDSKKAETGNTVRQSKSDQNRQTIKNTNEPRKRKKN
jgi:hypothetical protein